MERPVEPPLLICCKYGEPTDAVPSSTAKRARFATAFGAPGLVAGSAADLEGQLKLRGFTPHRNIWNKSAMVRVLEEHQLVEHDHREKDANCDWTELPGDLGLHLTTDCGFQLVKCFGGDNPGDNGCSGCMQRRFLASHFAGYCPKRNQISLNQTFNWLVYLNEEPTLWGSTGQTKNFTQTLTGGFFVGLQEDNSPYPDNFHAQAVEFNFQGTVGGNAKILELNLLDVTGHVLREVSNELTENGKSVEKPADGVYHMRGYEVECGPVFSFTMSPSEFTQCIREGPNGKSFALSATVEVVP
ncbi:hypothetical protein T484DRAFT_1867036 [Baffinella frigidus]|nr:hypothetical protein T484DRAFT_1867036 [Cryptophyta sp. CCMP2293]